MNTIMTTNRTNFGLRRLAAVMFLGLAASSAVAGSEPLAHSDVPDLPSVAPIVGSKDGWTSPPGKTAIKFEGGQVWIGDASGEDINLEENAPPPALTSIAPIAPPTSGGFVPAGAGPTVSSGSAFVPSTVSSIPAPAGIVIFGLAAAVGSRRRR